MKHTEDLHIQHKVNEEYTKNTSKHEEESRKSIEDEKLKVETEKKVSEAALKRDQSCPGGTEKELEE